MKDIDRMTGLLLFLCVVMEVHSQTFPYVRFGYTDPDLSNHSYVDLTRVGDSGNGSDSVQCHTDLPTCCSPTQGVHRGDWFFPNGNRLPLRGGDIHEIRGNQRVDLRRTNNAVTNGIYQCTIETIEINADAGRDIVYVGLYASGGDIFVHVHV